MGGRGAFAQRRAGVVAPRRNVKLASGGGGGATKDDAVNFINKSTANGDFPKLANFSQKKNVVDFSFDQFGKGGTIKIKDDNGRIFEGKFEGAGASRSTYSFKEGFVMKFDGLNGHPYGQQNREEVKAYKTLAPSVRSRVPKMVQAFNDVRVTNSSGTTRKVDILIMTRAKGGHDTGVKANSRQGARLEKRINQYISGMRKRGVNDMSVHTNGKGNIELHNIYYNAGAGKRLTLVDVGIGNQAVMRNVRRAEVLANRASKTARRKARRASK